MRISVVASFVLFVAPVTRADTWIIDGAGGGDFLDLPEAVAAAQPGDLLLVVPGSYSGFTLDKRIVVRSTAPGVSVGEVAVVGVPEGSEGAALSGLEIGGQLRIEECPGDFVCESIAIRGDFFYDSWLLVSDCASVAIDGLVTPTDAYNYAIPPPAAVRMSGSQVRITDAVIEGTDGNPTDRTDGGIGVEALDSYLVLARPNVQGGKGSHSDDYPLHPKPGLDGGTGLRADNSIVVVVGTETGVVQGGPGGDGGAPLFRNKAGDGGDGLASVNHSDVLWSRVQLLGGHHGEGFNGDADDGRDGQPWNGIKPTFHDVLPHLIVTPDLVPGDSVTATIDAVETGSVLLFLSDLGGFQAMTARDEGPMLSALPGPAFQVLALGTTDFFGDVATTGDVPSDPEFTGLVLELQAAELADSGAVYLSNAVVRVIGQ